MAQAAVDPQTTLHDEADIRRLSVNYALATDAIGRDDKPAGLAIYRRTFTPGAAIMVANHPKPTVGPEAWADYVESVFRGANYRATQHLIGTVDVTLDGETAEMSSYLQAAHVVAAEPRVFMVLGTYVDTAVRQPEGWRIAKRTLHVTATWWQLTGTG